MNRGDRSFGSGPGHSYVAPIVIVAAHVALALLLFEPTVFLGADPNQYMVLGQSLREGLGYRDIQLPGSPLHTTFPPVYPLILAAAGWFGGVQLFKLVSLVFAAGCVWLTYAISRRYMTGILAIVPAAIFAISPVLLDFSHRILSEAVFTFLLLTVVVSAPEGRRAWAFGLSAAAAAFFTRTAGLAVLLSLIVWTLLSRDWGRATVAIGVTAICAVTWAAYQHVAQPAQPGYLRQFVQVNPYFPSQGTIGLQELVWRSSQNLWRYVSSEFPGSLGFVTQRRGSIPATMAVGLILSAVVFIGWIKSALQELRFAHVLLVLYLGLILIWPRVWTDRRFLLPVLSLIVIFGVIGAREIAIRLNSRSGTAIVALLGAVVVATAAIATATEVPARVACQRSYLTGQPCVPSHYRDFYDMARWASAKTPSSAVIANRSPATFFLHSRRQGGLYEYSKDRAVVMLGLERMGADYVLVDRLSATTDLYLIPTIAAFPERFKLVHVIGDEHLTILLQRLPGTDDTWQTVR